MSIYEQLKDVIVLEDETGRAYSVEINIRATLPRIKESSQSGIVRDSQISGSSSPNNKQIHGYSIAEL